MSVSYEGRNSKRGVPLTGFLPESRPAAHPSRELGGEDDDGDRDGREEQDGRGEQGGEDLVPAVVDTPVLVLVVVV